MKKIIAISLLCILVIGCKSKLANYAFEKNGFYDDKIKLTNIKFNEREILFFPMHHIGTKEFYSDVGKKVDSLNKLGYFFYTEYVLMESADKNDLMKFRKILGVGLPKGGYEKLLDSILLENKISLNKEIAFQPNYSEWGLNNTNSKNVDANLKELVKEYESKFGEVKLEQCDLDSPDITNSTKCKKTKNHKKNYNTIVLNYRNHLIANKINSEPKQKLALIYGSGHYTGIKKILDSITSTE